MTDKFKQVALRSNKVVTNMKLEWNSVRRFPKDIRYQRSLSMLNTLMGTVYDVLYEYSEISAIDASMRNRNIKDYYMKLIAIGFPGLNSKSLKYNIIHLQEIYQKAMLDQATWIKLFMKEMPLALEYGCAIVGYIAKFA